MLDSMHYDMHKVRTLSILGSSEDKNFWFKELKKSFQIVIVEKERP